MPTIDSGHWNGRRTRLPHLAGSIVWQSRWGRRFRLPVEADFHRASKSRKRLCTPNAVLTTSVVRSVLLVIAMTRSRTGFFRIDSAFPASAPGRRHIGPFEACSSFTRVTACQVARPPFCGLCREVPTRPVSQPNRSPAIESNHQLFEWVLPPLVICPFRAHAEVCPTPSHPYLCEPKHPLIPGV